MKHILSVLLSLLPSICLAEGQASKTYELDMFSLVSFGLAIAALILSLFMAWLSWQFYVRSNQTADRTNETVTKIETLVAGIQSNITEIVQRAVSHWIESGSGDGELTENKREVYEKISELETAIQKSGSGDSAALLKEVGELKAQFEELGRSFRENRIKSLFPSVETSSQAVRYSQERTSSEENEQGGLIRVHVLKPTKVATATIKFDPYYAVAPEIEAKLISSPYDDDSSISAKAGTPGLKGCNVHLNSAAPLMPGEYIFEFKAKGANK